MRAPESPALYGVVSRAHAALRLQRYPLVLWVDGNHEAFQHGAELQRSASSAAGAFIPARALRRQRRTAPRSRSRAAPTPATGALSAQRRARLAADAGPAAFAIIARACQRLWRSEALSVGLELPANVVFLGARATHLAADGVLFVGACGWFDFDFCRPEVEPAAARARFNQSALDDWCAAAVV